MGRDSLVEIIAPRAARATAKMLLPFIF